MIDISFFVPCLNEESNVINTINTILLSIKRYNLKYEILVIDDNSSDNTLQVVEDYKNQNPDINLVLIQNDITKGVGTTYIDTAFVATGKYYMLVNGDNVEPEETLVLILDQIGKADIIIPYFGNEDNRKFFRIVLSKMFTKLVNFFNGYNIPYYNGPVLHLRYNVMRWSPDTHGYAYQAELISRILQEGFNFKGIQIKNNDRVTGQSSAFTVKNIFAVVHSLLQIFLRRLRILLFYRK